MGKNKPRLQFVSCFAENPALRALQTNPRVQELLSFQNFVMRSFTVGSLVCFILVNREGVGTKGLLSEIFRGRAVFFVVELYLVCRGIDHVV